jgi:hypothetical protein
MPKASAHQSSTITKRLLIGDSGVGKTTSLWSLVAKLDKRLRIFDFDQLLSTLIMKVKEECPERLDNIEFMSFRDKMKSTPMGPVIDGTPQAFVDSLRALDKWEDGSKPSEWGPDTICVVDSHTTQARSAFFWARGLQGASGIPEGVPTKGVDARAIFFTAQQALMNCIAMLTSASFNCNVLVLAHIKYLEQEGMTKGLPMSIGSAISPEIPTYFESVTLATKSVGTNPIRTLRTRSTNMIDLKDPRAFDPKFASELSMDDLYKLF